MRSEHSKIMFGTGWDNFESSSSDESENIDPISGSKSDPSVQSETEQDYQNSDQSDEDYTA